MVTLIQKVNGSRAGGGTNANDVYTFSSIPQDGDLIIFLCRAGTSAGNITPDGFAKVIFSSTVNRSGFYYYKIANSESSNVYTFLANGTNELFGVGYIFRGVNQETPFGTSATQNLTSWAGNPQTITISAEAGGAALAAFLHASATSSAADLPFALARGAYRGYLYDAVDLEAGNVNFSITANVEFTGSHTLFVLPIRPEPSAPPFGFSVTPTISTRTSDSYTLVGTLNESGNVYAVAVLPDAETDPTPAQIAAGLAGDDSPARGVGSATGVTAFEIAVTGAGLDANPSHDIHVVGRKIAP